MVHYFHPQMLWGQVFPTVNQCDIRPHNYASVIECNRQLYITGVHNALTQAEQVF